MDARTLTYRTTTAVTVFVLLSGGLAYLLGAEWAVAGVTALGYPAYVVTLLGVWKVLGAVALTVPGYARLKEWAYAGVAFDLSGATVSHLASGSAAFHAVVPTTLLVVAGRLLGDPARPHDASRRPPSAASRRPSPFPRPERSVRSPRGPGPPRPRRRRGRWPAGSRRRGP